MTTHKADKDKELKGLRKGVKELQMISSELLGQVDRIQHQEDQEAMQDHSVAKEHHQLTMDHPHNLLRQDINHQALQDQQETIQLHHQVLVTTHQDLALSIHRQLDHTQVQVPMFQMCHQQAISHHNKDHILHKEMHHTLLQDLPERPHHAITCHHDEDKQII